ncbi:hypothetical protein N9I08_04450 [Candidatus Pelagibacter sp.]|jgi:hypothetical protein|nr:hypothetical protein [Candidatus Pelagibacter sp.]|tara:strand:+ start:387 stop:611 length:225 start_codon:yes stop_codon:yes gene_type:complete
MQKTYFHNNKSFDENKDKKKLTQISKLNKKIVDINILLNRVKIEEKNEIKKKFIFFSFVTFVLCLFGTIIIIIK